MRDQELFDLLEGTSDAAFTITDQGKICSWNKAAERLFGYSKVEVLKKSCGSVDILSMASGKQAAGGGIG